MDLSRSQFERRIPQYLAILPSCHLLDIGTPVSSNNEWIYSAKGAASFQIRLSESKHQIRRIHIRAREPSEAALKDMRCMTYALMRATQPKYSIQLLALSDAKGLWRQALKDKTSSQYYFSSVFKASTQPLQLDVSGFD
jgi:uncharacterized protein YyaL (SSP411 family)